MKPVGGHSAPSWSHDGRFIAFSVFDGLPDNGIWVVAVDTGEVSPLDRGNSLYDPVFAKDDSSVYAAGADAFIVQLPFDAKTGKLRAQRTMIPVPGVPGVRGLSLSADGKRLAFAGLALDSQIWSLSIGADGSARGPATAVTSGTSRRNSLPVLSPDGKKIAYMSIRQGELPNVWVMDADGTNPIQLTSDETADHKPAWFSDSRRVAYMSKRGRSAGCGRSTSRPAVKSWCFDFAGAEKYPTLEGRLAEFQLSPSMTRIAFSLMTPPSGRRALYVANAKPFEPRALGSPTVSAGYPAWSPDETMLAVEIKDGGSTQAGVVDLQSGVLRQLTSRPRANVGAELVARREEDGGGRSTRWRVEPAMDRRGDREGIVVRAGESAARLRPLSRLVRAGRPPALRARRDPRQHLDDRDPIERLGGAASDSDDRERQRQPQEIAVAIRRATSPRAFAPA